MLAAPPSPRHPPMHQHSSPPQPRNLHVTPPHADEEDTLCAGCSRSVNSETGGVVVAFGNSLWHVDCFKCAKCSNTVDANTTLLLLSDGSPVCSNCYNCKVCNMPILDEAVMTGEDSYHAACFTCRTCHNRIDELIFAKTSQGFYCMNCHHERVARSRRHQARQQQKEKDRQGSHSRSRTGRGPSGSSRSKDSTAAVNGAPSTPSSSTLRTENATPLASSEGHHTQSVPFVSPGPLSVPWSHQSSEVSAVDMDATFADTSMMSMSSAADAEVVPTPARRVSVPLSSGSQPVGQALRSLSSNPRESIAKPPTRSQMHVENGDSAPPPITPISMPSIDIAPPPPYSISAPNDPPSSSSPTSLSVVLVGPVSSEPQLTVNDADSIISNSSLEYLHPSPRDRVDTLPLPSERSHGTDWPAGFDPTRRRKSCDESVRPSLLAVNGGRASPETASTFITPLGIPSGNSRRDKRRSINPGFQLDPAALKAFQEEAAAGPSGSSSPSSATVSAPNTPGGQGHARGETPPAAAGRESPMPSSPLRDYFMPDSDSKPASPGVERCASAVSGETKFYSSPSPQPPRSDSPGSSTTLAPDAAPGPPAPVKPHNLNVVDVLARPPQRSDSLRSPVLPTQLRPTTQRHQLKPQRSFDDRTARLSPLQDGNSAVDTRSGRPRSASTSRSTSSSGPDVPTGIESGTDTDVEVSDGERNRATAIRRSIEAPPPPPPKESKNEMQKFDDTQLSASYPTEAPTSAEMSSDQQVDSRDGSPSPSPPHSPVQRQSAFFIAPALPPIRFSMNETDFSEILKSVGNQTPGKGLPSTAKVPGETSSPPVALVKSMRTTPASAPSDKDFVFVDPPSGFNSTSGVVGTVAPVTPSTSHTDLHDITPKPVTRKMSKKGRTGKVPEAILLHSDRFPLLSGHDLGTVSSPASTSSSRVDTGKSSRPMSRGGTKPHVQDVISRRSDELTRVESPTMFNTNDVNGRERSASNPHRQVNGRSHLLSPPDTGSLQRPTVGKSDTSELVTRRLQEALSHATERGTDHVKIDLNFVEAILLAMEQKREQVSEMSNKLDRLKRTSQQIMDGMTVAQEEYDKELLARRNADAEVTRLRVELSGQAARLTAMSGDDRRRELQQQLSKELSANLDVLEHDVSKLKVERDMTLAEVEELSASKSASSVINNPDVPAGAVTRSLTMRLDNIKRQYQVELIPLNQQRETLMREILELKEARDIFLEETTVLNARNEELAQLNAQYERRFESSIGEPSSRKVTPPSAPLKNSSFDTFKSRPAPQVAPALSTATNSSATLYDDSSDSRTAKAQRSEEMPSGQSRPRGIGIRWPGHKGNKDAAPSPPLAIADSQKSKGRLDHMFQQLSVLRLTKCDHCGDKMWGSQLRCSCCNVSVHVRCVNHVQMSCLHDGVGRDETGAPPAPLPPSMFGRSLIEQVHSDSKGDTRMIPVIVEKCIDAVETLAMDYEGIYRKTGGSAQSKAITQLFERGNYDAFDLRNFDLFNDISSVTSVLKNYFRALPDPLLTYALHEDFVTAANLRDPARKAAALSELVTQLPQEHFYTLSHLMLHLHRVQLQSDQNRMNARNLGVVFGPTLMRSADVSREFADMAGKALSIEWLVENAPSVFSNAIAPQ